MSALSPLQWLCALWLIATVLAGLGFWALCRSCACGEAMADAEVVSLPLPSGPLPHASPDIVPPLAGTDRMRAKWDAASPEARARLMAWADEWVFVPEDELERKIAADRVPSTDGGEGDDGE